MKDGEQSNYFAGRINSLARKGFHQEEGHRKGGQPWTANVEDSERKK